MLPPRLPGSYLVLELTNRCSLKCVHCSVGEEAHPHHARTGFLDLGLALGLFEDLAASGARFDTLILFWLGEPLLHPDFGRIYQEAVRLCARHGSFLKVEVHSNATHLTARRVQVALNEAAVPQVWHFSLDAARRDTYARVKGVDLFERVEANLEHFLREKGRLGARWPRPVFQFIVGSNNVEEVGPFRARWERACGAAGLPVVAAAQDVPSGEEAVVYFRQLDCPTAELQARENAVFREAMAAQGLELPRQAKAPLQVEAHNPTACSGFWKSPVVGWQGDLTVCTRDNLFDNGLGRIGERSFSELWFGAIQRGRRERVARGDYGGLPGCTTCFIPRSSNYSELGEGDIAAQAAFDQRAAT